MRAIVHVLSQQLFGRSILLDDFPVRKDIRGLGLSDWLTYASGLAAKFDYINTFYDAEPRLDIRCIETRMHGSVDFLIATDVFEHVVQPVSIAFENARKLLKPGGVFVFSVPFAQETGARTVEHFPDLYDFEIQDGSGHKRLINRTIAGEVQEFENLVFHGGDGLTLEMRVFSRDSLCDELKGAGFREVRFHDEAEFSFGVYWPHPWSVPLSARA